MKQKKCIIIGAGVGGLAVAIRMAARGYNVVVVEKNSRPGGKIGEIRRKGFRFDTGPSLFTLPHLVDELLELGEQKNVYDFRYKKLKTVCRYFYDDKTCINAHANPADFAKEIAIQTGEPEQDLLQYLKNVQTLYEASADLFIFNPINRLFKVASKLDPATLKPLLRINPLRTMHTENARKFRSPHVIQLFDRYATYNGSSPYMASSMLNVIAHLEHNIGAFFPERGMYSIAETLFKKAQDLGVEFLFDRNVTGLTYAGQSITGINTNYSHEPADVVISDVDVNTFYRQIAPGIKKPAQVKRPNLSSSALVFYWGMQKEFPELDIHNILFSNRYKEEFRSLFNTQKPFDAPTVYLFISSKIVKDDAPVGCENWFVMINVPAIENHDWDILKNQARKYIITKIKRTLNIDPVPHILFEEVATPQTIQDFTGSYKGALYGNNSNSIWSAFLRHSNRSRQYKNLYFTGGSVHPGGGIPLCLASAKIVENEAKKHE